MTSPAGTPRHRTVAIRDRLDPVLLPIALTALFLALAVLAFGISPSAATLVALAALSISIYNLWRAELRAAAVSALLVDHPTARLAGNELAVRLQVSQPLVLENTGGRPCVLAGVELTEAWAGGGKWFGVGVSLRDAVVPSVLRPRDPVICRLVFDFAAYGTSPRGERFDLAAALAALRPDVPRAVTVAVTFAGDGRTRHLAIGAALNPDAVNRAFRSLIDRARWPADAAPDLRMPGDEEVPDDLALPG